MLWPTTETEYVDNGYSMRNGIVTRGDCVVFDPRWDVPVALIHRGSSPQPQKAVRRFAPPAKGANRG